MQADTLALLCYSHRRRRFDPLTGSDASLRRSVTFTLAGLPWKAVAMKVTSPVRCSVSGQAVGMGTCPDRWALQAAGEVCKSHGQHGSRSPWAGLSRKLPS